jgi:hypothetical protein
MSVPPVSPQAPRPSISFALFLLLGWIICVAAPLGRTELAPWSLVQPGILLLAWLSCRLVPFRGLSLGIVLRTWAWTCLAAGPLLAGIGWLMLRNTQVNQPAGLALLSVLVILTGAAALLALAARLLRSWPELDPRGLPAWQPASRTLAFLALSSLVVNPGWIGLSRHASPEGGTAAWGLALLALAVLWQGDWRPAWSSRLTRHPAWLGQAVVVGCGLAWALDLSWLVHTGRLPALALEPAIFWPGVLLLLGGTELLVLTRPWHLRPLPGATPRPPSRLPLWLCMAALLLALAAQRPGLALGAGVLAAWFAPPRRQAAVKT